VFSAVVVFFVFIAHCVFASFLAWLPLASFVQCLTSLRVFVAAGMVRLEVTYFWLLAMSSVRRWLCQVCRIPSCNSAMQRTGTWRNESQHSGAEKKQKHILRGRRITDCTMHCSVQLQHDASN